MLRPIKIPTKQTKEVLRVSGKSQPMLWKSEVSKTKGLGDLKSKSLYAQTLKSAANDIALLEAIAETPGREASFYAKQVRISYSKALVTLRQYEEDGVLESSPGDRRSRLWRLT